MTVNTYDFVEAMDHHWTVNLGNVSSKNLRATWLQMGSTFNDQCTRANPKLWQILQPATGTGKSQGTAVYCSMLAELSTEITIEHIMKSSQATDLHPGVLIVTRQIKDAENMAAQINELAGKETARASHSESQLSEAEITSTPVLIITHAAYTNALSSASSEVGNDLRLRLLHQWFHKERDLIIIDEAPDLIETTQVNIEHLKQVLGHIPEAIANRFPEEIAYLNNLLAWMKGLPSEGSREQMLPDKNMLSRQPDFSALRKAIKGQALDCSVVKRRDFDVNKNLHEIITETLKSIASLGDDWCMYAQSGKQGTLNHARHILPVDHPGAVILDATASTNLLHHLFEDQMEIIPTPEQARNYTNVTLHGSQGHRLGKGFLTNRKNVKNEAEKIAAFASSLAPNSEGVFVCCHKDLEYQLVGNSTFEVSHWGAIDGLNKWQDCDTAIIFGLPYRGNIWAANAFMAVQGPQSTEWLGDTGNRPFGQFTDILHELNVGVISTSIIQAINRVRCRRVVDQVGNCPITNVYIPLPNGKLGTEILDHIQTAMPGIQVLDWKYAGATRKVRKLKHAASLVAFLNNSIPGKIPAHELRKETGIPKSSFEKMIVKIKNEASDIYSDLMGIGVTYQVEGVGRGAKSYFLKS
ncbi:hypothetical protein V5T82_14540 [Magnetovibrio sp. PR-2]|uniref:hypothetical protein n=1 Tax=Magnetovibrio sp. PR-2 TaxID=3120356 RepID=UPI002FCE5465